MKKIIMLIFGIFILTGCTKINDLSYDEIINKKIQKPAKYDNIYRNGYKYYLPIGLRITNSEEYNEVISSEKNVYYLYVDIISYYNKVKFNYEPSEYSFYEKAYTFQDKNGYLNITEQQNDKYLIEIMYNYAKIEVIVDKDDINLTLVDAISILSSITYNDIIIKNLMGQDVLNFSEEKLDLFKTESAESNVLEIFEQEESYEEDIPDSDLIN